MDQIKGAQSIMFREAPYLSAPRLSQAKKEADNSIGKLFDVTDKDDLFGAQTWEEAESNMQKEACVLAAGKAHVDLKKIRYLLEGIFAAGNSNFNGGRGFADSDVRPLRSMFYIRRSACACIYERRRRIRRNDDRRHIKSFRKCGKRVSLSVRYANQRPLSSHWTVTGSGAFLVQSAEEYRKQNTKSYFSNIRITGVTVGKIVDYGLKDSQNMGACILRRPWIRLYRTSRIWKEKKKITTGLLQEI